MPSTQQRIMANIKELVRQELDTVQRKRAGQRFSSANGKDVRIIEAENLEKAKRVLAFAESVLQEFARQVGKKMRKISRTDGYGGINCMARYEIYTPNFLGFKKKYDSALEITVGLKGGQTGSGEHRSYYAGAVVKSSVSEYGQDLPITEINEKWFVTVLAKEYEEMNRRINW